MAITNNETMSPTDRLVVPYAPLAGIGSLLLGLATAVGLIFSLILGAAPGYAAAQGLLIVVFLAAAAAGGVLLRGAPKARKQALWVLLTFWLIVGAAGAVQFFALLLWGAWPLMPGAAAFWAVAIICAEMLFGAALAVALASATPPNTRDRYGAVVAASVAAAVAVVVAVNMVAFYTPWEHDFETLGQYGLSERSRRILAEVKEPIRLSAVYADARMEADTELERKTRSEARKHLDRVMELLDEMHRDYPLIEVQNASGDAARSRLMNELRAGQQEKTGRHEALLATIRAQLPEILKELQNARERWGRTAEESFLAQWDLAGEMKTALGEMQEKLRSADRKIKQEADTNPLPDYARLLEEMVAPLRVCKGLTQAESDLLTRLAKLPDDVRANAPKARKSVQECLQAVEAAEKLVRGGGEEGPRNADKVLQKLLTELTQTTAKLRSAATDLDNIAGSDPKQVELISASRAWRIDVPSPVGRLRTTRSRLLDSLAEQLDSLRAQVAIQVTDANPTAQRRFVVELRQPLEGLVKLMQQTRSAVEDGIKKLTTVDDASRATLEAAKTNRGFAALSKQIDPLIEQAEKLKTPKDDTLPPDLSGKNIVVIQAGKKVEVVSYDDVWPRQASLDRMALDAEDEQRIFNGDAVISSRLLKLVKKRPFARVLLTYFEPPMPPQMQFGGSQSEIPPAELGIVRQRLQEANFRVQDWNLSENMPQDQDEKADEEKTKDPSSQPSSAPSTKPAPEPLPVVLLVLPPAPPMPPMGPGQPPSPSFGPPHIEKIRRAVNDGATAVFLTCHLWPRMAGFGMPMPSVYPLNEYLQADWGLSAETRYFIVQGVQSKDEPGKFQISIETMLMPLNNFTNQPVGKCLQGRRVLWPNLCPISVAAKLPAGINVQTVLEVPDTMTNVWGVADMQRLIGEMDRGDGLVSPHYDKGDQRVPLKVAVAATREGGAESRLSPSRLVLLTMGTGMTNRYLQEPIVVATADGGFKPVPPPIANADLIVNSAYWLVGLEGYIAAGPSRVKPVEPMGRTTQTLLWVFCVIALPVAVAGAGVAVMIARKRP